MSDTDRPRARRALPARDAEPDSPAGSRRLWKPADPDATPSTSDAVGSPIPPPAPVLPQSEAGAPASAGRRFSAAELPTDNERPLPRRSALSPAATRARSPRSADEAEPLGARPGWRSTIRRPAVLAGLVALVILAVVVAALWPRPSAVAPTPTPSVATVDPVATYLLQPADLAGLRADTTWTAAITATAVGADTPQPACLPPAADTAPAPASSLVRTFAPAAGQAGGVLHQVDTYASPADAGAAFDARLGLLGACEENTAWVLSAATVTGLSDAATAVTLVLQDAQAEYHTIAISRTGTRVNVLDATQPTEAPALEPVVQALGLASGRQCVDSGGVCTTQVGVNPAVPPVVAPAGWLAGVDLPRITAGAGVWRGADLPELKLAGTRCEAVDLVNVPATTARAQRTYLLEDDTAAPAGFGVDEAVYTFATAEEAAAFAGTLTTNINQCPTRTATATVVATAELTGNSSGTAWTVTRRVSTASETALFRVAVQVAGNRVVYLLANPSAAFDFTDATWTSVSVRAGERLTQLP